MLTTNLIVFFMSEWCRKLILVDPSNVEPDALHRGFAVNCFAKYASGLPQGKCGDVLVLRGVQVSPSSTQRRDNYSVHCRS